MSTRRTTLPRIDVRLLLRKAKKKIVFRFVASLKKQRDGPVNLVDRYITADGSAGKFDFKRRRFVLEADC